LRIVKNYGDVIQARYLALAGIEKAKALLYQDAISRKRSGRNHSGDLYNAPQEFKDSQLGRGQFRVFHQADTRDGGGLIYGITDEDSRLNLNQASAEELGKLPDMTPDIAAAILDWRDEDNQPMAGGAEADYYASLQPPYLPRNGPFQTTRELLMVRGVTRELFGGEDANLNGILDPEEDDGDDSYPPDNRDGVLDSGWSGLLTVDSSVRNVSASGQTRINVQSADESSLTGVHGISSDIAKAIIAYRGQNRLESLVDLLDVSAAPQANQPAANQNSNSNGPDNPPNASPARPNAANAQASAQKVISEDLLLEVADDITTADGQEQAGLVNVNTASLAVLECLQGITPELAQAIISYRQSSGFLPNTATLLRVPGMTRQLVKQLSSKMTVRSETFRILSEGEIKSTGARQRIQAIVRLGASDIETLSWREDL
jgi:competence ComEA-like helix-hairpin-helix protein